ncbi:hypothetical protein, partial [Staphylococcus pettenkoferi]|uniref:hypothetical protein n=1 Tax=Staphylococcus pettenkoferi TaxID=170573 RepID=UPI001C92BB96
HKGLEKGNEDGENGKQNGENKVDGLRYDERGEMGSDVEKVDGMDIGDVNECDGNGVWDEVDKEGEEGEEGVKGGKSGDEGGEDKLKEGNGDGLIT